MDFSGPDTSASSNRVRTEYDKKYVATLAQQDPQFYKGGGKQERFR